MDSCVQSQRRKSKFLEQLRSRKSWRRSVTGSTSESTVTQHTVFTSDLRFRPSIAYVLTEVICSSDLSNKTLPFQIGGIRLMEQALLETFCTYTGIA